MLVAANKIPIAVCILCFTAIALLGQQTRILDEFQHRRLFTLFSRCLRLEVTLLITCLLRFKNVRNAYECFHSLRDFFHENNKNFSGRFVGSKTTHEFFARVINGASGAFLTHFWEVFARRQLRDRVQAHRFH